MCRLGKFPGGSRPALDLAGVENVENRPAQESSPCTAKTQVNNHTQAGKVCSSMQCGELTRRKLGLGRGFSMPLGRGFVCTPPQEADVADPRCESKNRADVVGAATAAIGQICGPGFGGGPDPLAQLTPELSTDHYCHSGRAASSSNDRPRKQTRPLGKSQSDPETWFGVLSKWEKL